MFKSHEAFYLTSLLGIVQRYGSSKTNLMSQGHGKDREGTGWTGATVRRILSVRRCCLWLPKTDWDGGLKGSGDFRIRVDQTNLYVRNNWWWPSLVCVASFFKHKTSIGSCCSKGNEHARIKKMPAFLSSLLREWVKGVARPTHHDSIPLEGPQILFHSAGTFQSSWQCQSDCRHCLAAWHESAPAFAVRSALLSGCWSLSLGHDQAFVRSQGAGRIQIFLQKMPWQVRQTSVWKRAVQSYNLQIIHTQRASKRAYLLNDALER